MRALVITNPHATAVTARQRDVVLHALASELEIDARDVTDPAPTVAVPARTVDVAETANRGHAAALACRAMRNGVDLVVALGGDGTVNEVVNGILTDGVHGGVPALGLIPAGSTNVFARALDIPTDPIEATGHLLQSLREGRRRTVGLGRADSRYFVFAAGIGFDAAIVRDVERARHRGKESTHALYVRTGLRTFVREDRRHPALTIELADGTTIPDIYFALATNADPWTFIGRRPLRPTPHASFDTGVDLYARRRMSLPSLLHGVYQVIRPRPRPGGRGVVVGHDASGFTITASRPMPFQVDGDWLGDREQVEIRAVPGAVTIVG